MRRAYEIFAHPLVLVDEPVGTIRRRIDAIFLGPPDTSTALANWSYLVISNFRKTIHIVTTHAQIKRGTLRLQNRSYPRLYERPGSR